MSLQTLSIDLEAKLARFTADMGQAARVSDRTAAQISGALGTIKAAAGGLVAGLSVGFFVQLTKSAIDSIDALNDVKDATGASIENLSALEDIAARTGTRFETVADTLTKFNKTLVDAKPGTDFAQAFDALGLSLEELKRLDPAEALRQTALAMAGFADDGSKARLQTVLFGRAVKDIAPFMKNLAEVGDLVATVTTEQAEEAEKFNRELLVMQKNVQDVTRTLASGLVQAINETAAEFRAATKDGQGFLTMMSNRYWKNVRGFYQDLGLVGPASPANTGGATGSFADAGGGRGFVNPPLVRPSVAEIGGGKTPKGGRGAGAPKAEPITEAQRALASYVDQLSNAIEKTQNLTEQEKALNFLRALGTTGQVQEVRELVLGLAQQVDSEKALAAAQEERIRLGRQYAIEQGDRVNQENEALAQRGAQLLAPTATAKLAESRSDMLFLTDLFEKGRIGETQYLEAVSARLDIAAAGYEKMTSFAEQAAHNIQDSIGSGLADMLGGNFDSIGKNFTKMINRMVAEAAAAKITEGLFGKGGTGGLFSGALGALGELLSFDGGGYTGNRPRSGGVDGRGGFLAVMHGNETVTDHTRGQSAGSVVVHISQQVGDIATVSMLQRNNAALVRQIQAGMARSAGYGGALS